MAGLELLAGDFGKGTATYNTGEFRLPDRRLQGAIHVTAVEINATVIQKHWGRAVADGVRNAVGLAPLAMLVGVFTAPLAMVGTIGIAAAAVGGAVGLLGGGPADKVLIQVTFEHGTGFVAVCDGETAKTIADDARRLREQAARERRAQEPSLLTRLLGVPAPSTVTGVPAVVASLSTAILPPVPPPSTIPPPDAESVPPGLLESLSDGATEAVERTGQALSDAFDFVKRTTGLDTK